MEIFLVFCLPCILAYFTGSIPFGLLLTRMSGYGDIRTIGSGNIGATNVMRTGNKKLAVLTLVLDGLKGYFPVLFAGNILIALTGDTQVPPCNTLLVGAVLGICIMLGHIFPIWLKFKGGKGVATAIGVIAALNPVLALSIAIAWLVTFKLTRFSSLSALTAFAVATGLSLSPVTGFTAQQCMDSSLYFTIMLVITLLLCFTHRENIKRLLDGTEHKWSKK